MAKIGLPHHSRGKVRDLYQVDDDRMLMVASDRISVFDVVLPDLIPDKGRALTALSDHWIENTASVWPNHLISVEKRQLLQHQPLRRLFLKLLDPSPKDSPPSQLHRQDRQKPLFLQKEPKWQTALRNWPVFAVKQNQQ